MSSSSEADLSQESEADVSEEEEQYGERDDCDDEEEQDEDEDEVEESDDEGPSTWDAVKDFLNEEDPLMILEPEKVLVEVEDEDQGDPLGIIPPFSRDRRLLRRNEIVRNQLMMKDETLRLDSEKFNPMCFLSKIHDKTPYTVLAGAHGKLFDHLDSKTEDIKALVRSNFERFIQCKDTIDNIHKLVIENEIDPQGQGTVKLEACFQDLIKHANQVFHMLLSRKKEVERIRNTLQILDRARFLFRLPAQLREAVKKDEHEKVVHSYHLARKQIGLDNENVIFRRTLSDCESIVEEYREKLFRVLEDPTAPFQQHERLIGVLWQLGPTARGDPLQHFVTHHKKRVAQLLVSTSATYNNFRQQYYEQWSGTARKPNSTLDETDPKLVYIRQLCEIVTLQLTSFFSLANFFSATHKSEVDRADGPSSFVSRRFRRAQKYRIVRVYFDDNSFAPVRIQPSTCYRELLQQIVEYRRVIDPGVQENDFSICVSTYKGKSGITEEVLETTTSPWKLVKQWGEKSECWFLCKRRYRATRGLSAADLGAEPTLEAQPFSDQGQGLEQQDVRDVVDELLLLFTQKVSEIFKDPNENEAEALIPRDRVLQECILEVRKLRQVLQQHGIPPSWLEVVVSLVNDMKRHFVNRVCEECAEAAAFLHYEEDWVLVPEAFGCCTNLPREFLNQVKEWLKLLNAVVAKEGPAQSEVQSAFMNSILGFADSLHHLAFYRPPDEDKEDDGEDTLCYSNIHEAINILNVPMEADELSPDKKILAVLANADYTRTVVLPDLFKTLGWLSRTERVFAVMNTLEEVILHRYYKRKSIKLNAVVRRLVLAGGVNWRAPPAPTGPSDFVLLLLLQFVAIHSEVSFIPQFVKPIFAPLQENVLQCLRDCILAIPSLGHNGVLQLAVDIEFLKIVLARHRSTHSMQAGQSVFELLERLDEPGEGEEGILSGPKCQSLITKLVDTALEECKTVYGCLLE